MKEELEAILNSGKPFEEQLKELDQLFDEVCDSLEHRKRSLLSPGEDCEADTVSIYDFMTEEDFERNPIP